MCQEADTKSDVPQDCYKNGCPSPPVQLRLSAAPGCLPTLKLRDPDVTDRQACASYRVSDYECDHERREPSSVITDSV